MADLRNLAWRLFPRRMCITRFEVNSAWLKIIQEPCWRLPRIWNAIWRCHWSKLFEKQSIQNLKLLRRHTCCVSFQFCFIFIFVLLSTVGGHRSSNLQLKTSLGYLCSTSALCGHLLKLKTTLRGWTWNNKERERDDKTKTETNIKDIHCSHSHSLFGGHCQFGFVRMWPPSAFQCKTLLSWTNRKNALMPVSKWVTVCNLAFCESFCYSNQDCRIAEY